MSTKFDRKAKAVLFVVMLALAEARCITQCALLHHGCKSGVRKDGAAAETTIDMLVDSQSDDLFHPSLPATLSHLGSATPANPWHFSFPACSPRRHGFHERPFKLNSLRQCQVAYSLPRTSMTVRLGGNRRAHAVPSRIVTFIGCLALGSRAGSHCARAVKPVTSLQSTRPHLRVRPSQAASATAVVGIVVPAVVAVHLETTAAGKAMSGALMSYGIAAAIGLSNLLPVTDPAYDFCWDVLLPGSLALTLLRSAGEPAGELAESSCNKSSASSFAVGVGFVLGSFGSAVGAIAAIPVGVALGLSRLAAKQLAACITATLIGGSVNLFQVASLVGLRESGYGKSLLGTLASADVMIMAAYIACLLAAEAGKHKTTSQHVMGKSEAGGFGVAVSAGLTVAIMSVANAASISSLSAFIITVLGAIATAAIRRCTPPRLARAVGRASADMARLSLYAFFAAVGAGSRPQRAAVAGPAVVAMLSVAYAIHALFCLGGGHAFSRDPCGTSLRVASNACVGGAATAAGYAAAVGSDEVIVRAGALWGTVGYAIATAVGLEVFKAT